MKTRKAKRAFIRALVKAVTKDVLSKVPYMPPEWAGQELREYVADSFEASCILRQYQNGSGIYQKECRRRLRAYKSDVATRTP